MYVNWLVQFIEMVFLITWSTMTLNQIGQNIDTSNKKNKVIIKGRCVNFDHSSIEQSRSTFVPIYIMFYICWWSLDLCPHVFPNVWSKCIIPKGSIIKQNSPLLKVVNKWILKYVFKLINDVHNQNYVILNQHNHASFNI